MCLRRVSKDKCKKSSLGWVAVDVEQSLVRSVLDLEEGFFHSVRCGGHQDHPVHELREKEGLPGLVSGARWELQRLCHL